MFTALFTRRKPLPPRVETTRTWRVDFHANGVLIHGSHVEARNRDDAIHRATAHATAELAMRGHRLKYESIVASLG